MTRFSSGYSSASFHKACSASFLETRYGTIGCWDVNASSSVYGFQSLSVTGPLKTGSARPVKAPIDPVKEICSMPASAAWRITLAVPPTAFYGVVQVSVIVCAKTKRDKVLTSINALVSSRPGRGDAT